MFLVLHESQTGEKIALDLSKAIEIKENKGKSGTKILIRNEGPEELELFNVLESIDKVVEMANELKLRMLR
jgi:hypothetical protein